MTLTARIERIARKLEDPDDIGSSDPAENADGDCIQVSRGGWWWWYDGEGPDSEVHLTGDTDGWLIARLIHAGAYFESDPASGDLTVALDCSFGRSHHPHLLTAVVESAEKALGVTDGL